MAVCRVRGTLDDTSWLRPTRHIERSSLGSCRPRAMKSLRDSLLNATGSFMTPSRTVFRATKAGGLYAIIVFLIGFILGTIRVLLVAPRLGETTAVIIEAPIMLAASWFVCRWCVDRLHVTRNVPA